MEITAKILLKPATALEKAHVQSSNQASLQCGTLRDPDKNRKSDQNHSANISLKRTSGDDGQSKPNAVGDNGYVSHSASDDQAFPDRRNTKTHSVDREDFWCQLTQSMHPDLLSYLGTVSNASQSSTEVQTQILSDALQLLCCLMVKSDSDDGMLWDRFMELGIMKWLLLALQRTKLSFFERTSNEDLGMAPGGAYSSAGTTSLPVFRMFTRSNSSNVSMQADESGVNVRPDEDFQTVDRPLHRHMESTSMPLLSRENVFDRDFRVGIQVHILRTLSIIIQSVSRMESLYYLFSGNYINDLISFDFDSTNEEVVMQLMSMIKAIAMRLDECLVQFFVDEVSGSFPLYTVTTRYFACSEGMVRIAVRNITLSLYSLCSPVVQRFILQTSDGYLCSVVARLDRYCGESARAFQHLLDDGREIRRSVTARVGQFRQKVRMPQLIAVLAEVDNIYEYLNEVASVPDEKLQARVVEVVCSLFFGPFFRPIASCASPNSVAMSRSKWLFGRADNDSLKTVECAISEYDACARCLILTYLVDLTTSSVLGGALFAELVRPSTTFEGRCILHGLKAMASNLQGFERSTHIALCALEAVISCALFPQSILAKHGLAFDVEEAVQALGSSTKAGSVEETNSEGEGEKPAVQAVLPSDANDTGNENMFKEHHHSYVACPNRRGSSGTGSDLLTLNLDEYSAPLTPTLSLAGSSSVSQDFSNDEREECGSEGALQSNAAFDGQAIAAADESVHMLFRQGEASFREIVSAILLIVRPSEVRSPRVIQAVSRLILSLGRRTGDWNSCMELTKAILDQMASGMIDFLVSRDTTIVAIEMTFDNFFSSFVADSASRCTALHLRTLLRLESLPTFVTFLPPEAGRRKRSRSPVDSAAPPVEKEDSCAYFVMVETFERVVTEMLISRRMPTPDPKTDPKCLMYAVTSVLRDLDSTCTYQDKKQALARLAHDTLQYSACRRLRD